MAAPASAVERKKAEAAENTFVVRPPIRQRFPVPVVKDIIARIMKEKLTGAKYGAELGKDIADAVKAEVRGAWPSHEFSAAAELRLCAPPPPPRFAELSFMSTLQTSGYFGTRSWCT